MHGKNIFSNNWGSNPISPFFSSGSFEKAIWTKFLREIFSVMFFKSRSSITNYYLIHEYKSRFWVDILGFLHELKFGSKSEFISLF